MNKTDNEIDLIGNFKITASDSETPITMAKSQLAAIAAKSDKILEALNKIPGVEEKINEPWLFAKITIAENYVNTVLSYLMYHGEDQHKEFHNLPTTEDKKV
jgi:uncharacterized protein YkvS